MNNYLGKEFHRKAAMDVSKEQKQASQLLKQSTRGESLQEWFDREKKKPAPQAEDAEEKKSNGKKQDYDPDCLICQQEGPRDNNNGKHQHVYQE